MENKFVEFIENNKKVVISSLAVGAVLALGFGWYSHSQHQAEQEAKIVQLEKDSKLDKEQVDKLFESFDVSSDESISKLKDLSETSVKTDTGKDYLNNKVKESAKAIVDFHLQKGLNYDVKDSDDKFKDKATLENNLKEINKQIDFIKKVDETFKQEKLDETVKSLTDVTDKFQKQIDVLKKEESASSQSSNSSSESSSNAGSSSSSNSYAPEQTYTSDNSESYSGSTGGDTGNYEAPAAAEQPDASNGGYDGYERRYGMDANGNHTGDFYLNHSNGDVRDTSGNHLGNIGGGIADFRQR
ncbi:MULTISPECIES: hypothetical protein [Streptococcus]|uniref:hypothetical protein n=1 Tax=Streptococcus TaxID=1301 RepID=UPI0011060683|nr:MULTISPECIES: hypothetical protein [Streptococcus]